MTSASEEGRGSGGLGVAVTVVVAGVSGLTGGVIGVWEGRVCLNGVFVSVSVSVEGPGGSLTGELLAMWFSL